MRPTDGTPKRGGVLRAAFGVTTSNFDIIQGGSGSVLWQLYNNLVRFNPIDGLNTIVPDLAESWEKSADGKTFTFKLRQGVKYTDGTVFSSADVVASINRVKNPPEGSISTAKSQFAVVDKVEAPDANTVKFTLTKPVSYFLEIMAKEPAMIFSKKSIDDNKGDFRKVIPPGTGAFKLKEHRVGERWLFDKNPDYFDKELPYLDGLELIHAAAWSDRGTAVLTGQADMSWNVSKETWDEGAKKPNEFKTARPPSTGSYVLWMNCAKKPLDNPKVRQAINLAISRQDLYVAFQTQEQMKLSRYQPVASPLALTPEEVGKLPGYRQDKTEDMATAQGLLKDAGIAPGTPIEILCANVAPHAELLAPAVQQMLNKLGFKASIRTLERALLVEERQVKGNFDIALDTSGLPTLDPTLGWLNYFKTGASGNFYKYSNADVDKWLDQLEIEIDDAKRKALAKQIEDQLDKDGPWVNIGFTDHLPMWSAKVKGLSLDKRKFSEWNRFDTAWLDK
jgi:peptide/nickel transport system substrate-binding protein